MKPIDLWHEKSLTARPCDNCVCRATSGLFGGCLICADCIKILRFLHAFSKGVIK